MRVIIGGFFYEHFSYLRAIRYYDIFQRQDKPLDKVTALYYIEGIPTEEIINAIG